MSRRKHVPDSVEALRMAASLSAYARSNALSQRDLARLLGASQSTISRVLNREATPDPKLRRRINALTARAMPPKVTEEWLRAVAEKAERSQVFAQFVDLGLHYLDING